MRKAPLVAAAIFFALGLSIAPRFLISKVTTGSDFVNFESAHVHPIALTPDNTKLLAVNTPDNRLVVFDITGPAPARTLQIPVGLEPVAVAARTNNEAWVVNHVSDDVSVVDLTTGNVRATLRVGDEPFDVAFAGSPERAYVTVGQEDAVKVYDPAALSAAPVVIPIAGRKPRTLATNAARTKVFVGVFESGNKASIVPTALVEDSLPAPDPPRNPALGPAPAVGLIVQQQAGNWVDIAGKLWNSKMPFNAADLDAAEIDAASNTITRSLAGVGSHIFGLAVNPVDGKLAIVASDARNLIRFEPKLRGYLVETRLKLWSTTGVVTSRILNPHIVYETLPAPATEADSALGQPMDMAYAPSGNRIYVACMSTDMIGVVSSTGFVQARIPVGGGPSGVKVDPSRNRLYVLNRFRNQLQTLDLGSMASIGMANLGYDPTPDEVVNGRRHFYSGRTSGHGDQSCNTCHLFADTDNLAWDLGDPAGAHDPPPAGQSDTMLVGFDPMKGPMVTQTLRGLSTTEPFHWRGDRSGITAFNPAFDKLMGLPAQLADSSMGAFAQFVMSVTYPPNPYMNLDRTQRVTGTIPNPASGESLFVNRPIQGAQRCADCHAPTEGTNRQIVHAAAILQTQDFKVPHLRNLYQKVGFDRTPAGTPLRGFGFTNDGSVDKLFNFLQSARFSFTAGPEGDDERRNVEAFLFAFDTGMAPAVGRQITFDGANNEDAGPMATLDTLVAQADLNNCDLMAKGVKNGQQRGWVYVGGGQFRSDRYGEGLITTAALRGLAAAGSEITFTGVPEGAGTRIGVDRDRDGFYDRDELDIGADPEDPTSPGSVAVGGPRPSFGLRAVKPNPFRERTEVDFALRAAGRVDLRVYDVLGRQVRSVARGLWLEAGPQSLAWDGLRNDGRASSAGIYFVRLRADGREFSRAVVKLR